MDFLEEYLKKGYGSMNKNDVEVLVFHMLLQQEKTEKQFGLKGMTDFAISVELKIPESKVKRLRYESELKYPLYKEDSEKKVALLQLLNKVQYKQDGKKFVFVVTDKMLRLYISDLLVKDGRFFDTSFNSNIVSLYIEDFIALLKVLFTKQDREKIIKSAKEHIKKQVDQFPEEPNEIFDFAIHKVVEGIARLCFGNFTVEGLMELIKKIKLLEND